MLTHHGTAYGATSYFAVYPEYRLAISVVMNRDANGAPLIPESAPQLESIAFRAVIARQAQQTTTE